MNYILTYNNGLDEPHTIKDVARVSFNPFGLEYTVIRMIDGQEFTRTAHIQLGPQYEVHVKAVLQPVWARE